MLQAVGGSMLNPVAMSIIRNVFTDARERAQAIGVWGATVGISLALGPVVGGALVEGVGWRSIFWINVPIGLVAVLLTMRFVPESRAPHPRRVDPVGQLLVIVMLASLTYAIIAAPDAGWLSDQTLALFALSAVSLVALVPYERRRTEPLLELRFFRSVPFSSASAIAVLAFAAWERSCCSTPSTCRRCAGFSALHAGLFTLPIASSTIVFSPLSGRIRRASRPAYRPAPRRHRARARWRADERRHATTPLAALLPAYLVFGAGFGMVNPPITNTAVLGMPAAQAGVAAAVASTSRQVGQTLGVAVSARSPPAPAGSSGPGFIAGSEPGWWIVAGCGLAVLGLGLASTTRRAQASAERVSEELAAPVRRAPRPSPPGPRASVAAPASARAATLGGRPCPDLAQALSGTAPTLPRRRWSGRRRWGRCGRRCSSSSIERHVFRRDFRLGCQFFGEGQRREAAPEQFVEFRVDREDVQRGGQFGPVDGVLAEHRLGGIVDAVADRAGVDRQPFGEVPLTAVGSASTPAPESICA